MLTHGYGDGGWTSLSIYIHTRRGEVETGKRDGMVFRPRLDMKVKESIVSTETHLPPFLFFQPFLSCRSSPLPSPFPPVPFCSKAFMRGIPIYQSRLYLFRPIDHRPPAFPDLASSTSSAFDPETSAMTTRRSRFASILPAQPFAPVSCSTRRRSTERWPDGQSC